jgi:nucleoside-diphosphate-sugar epimerase
MTATDITTTEDFMRVFVTGATGFIGSATVAELLTAGHEVVGLARSDEAAAALAKSGAEVHRGSLEDLDSLRRGAADSDGVIHTAFIHDFSQMETNGRVDLRAVEAFGAELEGSDRPLVITSGTGLVAPGRLATEQDAADPAGLGAHRAASEQAAIALADRGVRSAVVRFPPSVHGEGDHGFVPFLIDIARDKGLAAYIGDGSNRWPAVHRLDAACLFRLAVESAPAGSVLHGVGEAGVATRDIATMIGRHLNVPAVSISPQDAAEHFGWLAAFFGADLPASSELTRRRLRWEPVQPGLIADLEAGHYFRQPVIARAART